MKSKTGIHLFQLMLKKTVLIKIKFIEMFRLNIMAKFPLKINKDIDFGGISYLQSPLNSNFNKNRWFFDSNLNFNVNKHILFNLH
jgi:hypothetical protein